MWIVARKTNRSLVEIIRVRPEPILDALKFAIVANYGGTANDYAFYQTSDATIQSRIDNGDQYALIWDNMGTAGDPLDDEITGVDFSVENTKRWVKVYEQTGKQFINGNGTDTATIIIEIWNSALTAIDTNITGVTKKIPIAMPVYGTVFKEATFTNGVATMPISSKIYGSWMIPSDSVRYENTRVAQTCSFNVMLV